MSGIILFAEKTSRGLELASLANGLASQLPQPVMAVSLPLPEMIEAYQNHGVDQILALPALEEGQGLDAYEPLLIDAIASLKPGLVLMASSPLMRNLAARLAQALDTGLVSDCTSVMAHSDSGQFSFQRTAFGGTAIENLKIDSLPAMATVPPGTSTIAGAAPRACQVSELDGKPASPLRILEQKESSGGQKDLSEAPCVICVGRGFDKPEDLELARTCAQLLGAEIACTRPLSEELNWLPAELCIGLSGQKLKADVCLELGISGQIQHVTGIKDCRTICAVNKDENALIFKTADYGIIGDIYEILPALNEAIKKIL